MTNHLQKLKVFCSLHVQWCTTQVFGAHTCLWCTMYLCTVEVVDKSRFHNHRWTDMCYSVNILSPCYIVGKIKECPHVLLLQAGSTFGHFLQSFIQLLVCSKHLTNLSSFRAEEAQKKNIELSVYMSLPEIECLSSKGME